MKNDRAFIQTFYSKPDLQRAVMNLKKNGIRVNMEDKSGAVNYKVPGSAYFEVHLFCENKNEAKARKIIEESA